MSFERMTFEDVSDLAHSYSVGLISIAFTLFLTINFKSLQCLKTFISLVIKKMLSLCINFDLTLKGETFKLQQFYTKYL